MKVAIIINSLRIGGAEVQTVELANSLADRGFEILLLCIGKEIQIIERVSNKIKVVELNKKIYLDLKVLFKITKQLKEFKPQTVLMINSYSTMYGYIASFFTGRSFKMLAIQHTTLFSGMLDRLKNIVDLRIVNRMDGIVFVCNNQRLHWINNYGTNQNKAFVVYNGIDLERFKDFDSNPSLVREELGFKSNDIIIGLNANLRPEKKHEDIIDALGLLINEGYPVKLLIIGDGVRRNHIEEYIKAKEVGDKVIITGFLKDVRPYLSCLDISVLTSVAVETLSIAIIESMAMGKPVVLSDIGGAKELVDLGDNGYIYEAGNVKQLVEALKEIIDRKLFDSMGKKSSEKAEKLFSKNIMVDKYIELIKN